MFKDHATPEQIQDYVQKVNANGGQVSNQYSTMKGFAASIPESFLSDLQGDDIIEYIEPDGVVTTQ